MVQSARLHISRESSGQVVAEFDLPVAGFSVEFAMDQLPMAQVQPAIGKGLLSDSEVTLSDIRERDSADLYLTVNDEEHLMLAGYISNISTGDESSVFSRRISGIISIRHITVKLAGAPTTSFVYSGRLGSPLRTLADGKAGTNIFDPTTSEQSTYPITSYIAAFLAKFGNSWEVPGFVMKNICANLFKQLNDAQLSQDKLDEMIQVYTPASLSSLLLIPTTFLEQLGNKFSAAWMSQNCWEALTATCQWLLLHIIPYNKGFYIADPYSLDRVTSLKIGSGEYIRISKSRQSNLSEPVDGIVMMDPAGSKYSQTQDVSNYYRDAYIFPRPEEGIALQPNRYYHYRQFPLWLRKERAWCRGPA